MNHNLLIFAIAVGFFGPFLFIRYNLSKCSAYILRKNRLFTTTLRGSILRSIPVISLGAFSIYLLYYYQSHLISGFIALASILIGVILFHNSFRSNLAGKLTDHIDIAFISKDTVSLHLAKATLEIPDLAITFKSLIDFKGINKIVLTSHLLNNRSKSRKNGNTANNLIFKLLKAHYTNPQVVSNNIKIIGSSKMSVPVFFVVKFRVYKKLALSYMGLKWAFIKAFLNISFKDSKTISECEKNYKSALSARKKIRRAETTIEIDMKYIMQLK